MYSFFIIAGGKELPSGDNIYLWRYPMDIKTADKVKAIHKDAVDNNYSKTTWWPQIKASLAPTEMQELVSSAKMGLDYLLGNENIEALAVTMFPWMMREMTRQTPIKNQKGEETGEVSTITYPSWLAKMKENKATAKPNDLVHLARICEIAENIESYDDMI
jgi:hypothetical protein